MGKKQRSQSLASRKRAKDVSSAMFENTSFHAEAKGLLVDAPKKGYETAVPRKLLEMQKAMARVTDKQAGRTVTWRAHRESVPKPKSANEGNRPPKKMAQQGDTPTAANAEVSRGGAVDSGNSSGGGGIGGEPTIESLPRLKQPPPRQATPQGGDASQRTASARDAAALVGQKRAREGDRGGPQRAKFGETNAAPPTLLVGGRLKKQAQAARNSAQAREDALARQRAQVQAAYAQMKAARRQAS